MSIFKIWEEAVGSLKEKEKKALGVKPPKKKAAKKKAKRKGGMGAEDIMKKLKELEKEKKK